MSLSPLQHDFGFEPISLMVTHPTVLVTRTPGYNASKAALHSFIVNVRQQIKDAGYNIRLVEVFPPAVQTEIHDTKHQPDMINGHEIGMPLGPYTERMYEGLQKGDEQFAIGHAEEYVKLPLPFSP